MTFPMRACLERDPVLHLSSLAAAVLIPLSLPSPRILRVDPLSHRPPTTPEESEPEGLLPRSKNLVHVLRQTHSRGTMHAPREG